MSILRPTYLIVAVAGASVLQAQEAAPETSFCPMREGYEIGDWQALVANLTIASTIYLLWRGLVWFIESKRDKIPWRRAQRWWPPSILSVSAITFGVGQLFSRDSWGAALQDATMGLVVILNLPAMIIGAPFLAMASELSPWLHFSVAITTVWLAWHVLLVFLEWRAFVNEWIFLRPH